MRNPEIIESKQRRIDAKVRSKGRRGHKMVIRDGIISTRKYFAAKFKILWIAEEPYSRGRRSFDFKTTFRDSFSDRTKENGPDRHSLLRTVTYGILNNLTEMSKVQAVIDQSIRNRNSAYLSISKTAYVNVSKYAARRHQSKDLVRRYRDFEDILFQQLTIADPQIIICLGTFKIVRAAISSWLSDRQMVKHKEKFNYRPYFIAADRLIVDSYHFSQRTISDDRYVNHILKTVRSCRNRGVFAVRSRSKNPKSM